MGFDSYKLLGNHKVECLTCGKIIETGLISVSSHWVECTGKDLHNALLKERGKGYPLDISTIDRLREKHIDSNLSLK